MNTEEKTTIVDQIIDGLRNTATELEELRVQTALGKAELKDIFETLKKKLYNEIHETRNKLMNIEQHPSLLPLINALEHLKIQLSLGYAEGKEAFEEQRKRIEAGLNALEARLESGIPQNSLIGIQLDIERFRAKLHLMALGYKLKKLSFEYQLGLKEKELEKKLGEIKNEISTSIKVANNEWQHTKKHIKNTAEDLRKLLFA
ncbi:MAG: hypothetical protein JNL60_05255 [Bacteroidia bacterium]|nr:hypothetical protein [Bacteroidia bacterium]